MINSTAITTVSTLEGNIEIDNTGNLKQLFTCTVGRGKYRRIFTKPQSGNVNTIHPRLME